MIASTSTSKGDINGDGKLNVSDLTALAAHVKGKRLLKNTSKADVNGDGKVNISDVSSLAAAIKGKKKLK